ncbi:MAG: hypothetical protein FWD86_01490, partial [Firmicutes bacterium]|nr:hypothetical protein [Bacillota bacterium]
MEKTIYDIMIDGQAPIDNFYQAVDNLLSSQYIMADGKISAVLQSIAISRDLHNLFERILKDFNSRAELKEYRANGFLLPDSAKKIACLMFVILLEIDKGHNGLNDFLTMFYHGDPKDGFGVFLKNAVVPFKMAVSTLLQSEEQIKNEQKLMSGLKQRE